MSTTREARRRYPHRKTTLEFNLGLERRFTRLSAENEKIFHGCIGHFWSAVVRM